MLSLIHIKSFSGITDSHSCRNASSPGIFQRVMESLLSDIPRVLVYLHDILITGPTDADHLKSLQETITFGKSWTEVAETEV